MIYSIEVCLKAGQPDPRGSGIARGIHDLGIHKTVAVKLVFYGCAALITGIVGFSLARIGF